MDQLTDFYPAILAVALVLLAGLAGTPLLARLGLPGPAAFLAAGIAAGLLGIVPADDVGAVPLQEIGAIALYAILFQGGLSTGFREWRACAGPILLLGLVGTAATAAGLAALGHGVLGYGWALAAFVGIALAPTDPAAVYALLRGRAGRSRARTVLEGESGFNDPVGISLMVVAVALVADPGTSVASGALRLAEELLIGLAGGAVGALALFVLIGLTTRLEEGFQGVVLLLGALAVGAATASLHGSGFLAVYLAGLLVADRWAASAGRHHAVPEAAGAIAEPVLFGLLGASFAPLVGADALWQGVALALLTALLVRPAVSLACLVGSGLSRGERVVVSWGGLKGAVPLLLGAYPALEGLGEADAAKAVVLVATAASIVVQGASLRVIASRVLA
jgi:cell volume regulation protein A